MFQLKDYVTILENNEACVVLQVKPDSRIPLISMGCFTGNEEMMRMTKGAKTHTVTIFYNDQSTASWYTGKTMTSEATERMEKLIRHCLEDDFDICIHGDTDAIKSTCHIRNLGDTTGETQTYQIIWFEKHMFDVSIHKNGHFLRQVPGEYTAKEFIHNMLSSILSETKTYADNGASIVTIKGIRK